jgi:hypothetical protein
MVAQQLEPHCGCRRAGGWHQPFYNFYGHRDGPLGQTRRRKPVPVINEIYANHLVSCLLGCPVPPHPLREPHFTFENKGVNNKSRATTMNWPALAEPVARPGAIFCRRFLSRYHLIPFTSSYSILSHSHRFRIAIEFGVMRSDAASLRMVKSGRRSRLETV